MLSNSSSKYFNLFNKLKYLLYKINENEKDFLKLVLKGVLPRPQYALGLFLSANIASQLGYKKISVIEFGCWEGEGLLDLEHYSEDIERLFNLKIEIYGFEGGEGLPKPKDYKDRVYQFTAGEMKLSKNSCIKKLKKSKIIYGNFQNTVTNFIEKGNFAPIAALFNDADYFFSTQESLKILCQKNKLPKVFLYFDDLNFSSSLTGELGAINDFNLNNKSKIETIPELAETMSMFWKKWSFLGKRFFIHHDFNHEKYNIRYENPLYKNLRFYKNI